MPKTRLISPGSIPNHKLLKNLQLQGNYISNDGGDEGITIQDDGDMVLNSSGTATLFLKDAGGEYISCTGAALNAVGDSININILRDKRLIQVDNVTLKVFPVPTDKMYGNRNLSVPVPNKNKN